MSRRRMSRRAVLAGLSFLAGLAAAPAEASTVSASGDGRLVVQALPGEVNHPHVTFFDARVDEVVGPNGEIVEVPVPPYVQVSEENLVAGAGCSQRLEFVNVVDCPWVGLRQLVLNLGDGDDRYDDSERSDAPPLAIVASGGEGNDVLTGGPFADDLDGGPGDDVVIGGDGDDRLTGGPGKDVLIGNEGRDTVLTADGEADEINCGAGRDVLQGDPSLDGPYAHEPFDLLRTRCETDPTLRPRVVRARGHAIHHMSELAVKVTCTRSDCAGRIRIAAIAESFETPHGTIVLPYRHRHGPTARFRGTTSHVRIHLTAVQRFLLRFTPAIARFALAWEATDGDGHKTHGIRWDDIQ